MPNSKACITTMAMWSLCDMPIVMETELIILLIKVDLWYLTIRLSGTRLVIKLKWCLDYASVCWMAGVDHICSRHCESDCWCGDLHTIKNYLCLSHTLHVHTCTPDGCFKLSSSFPCVHMMVVLSYPNQNQPRVCHRLGTIHVMKSFLFLFFIHFIFTIWQSGNFLILYK